MQLNIKADATVRAVKLLAAKKGIPATRAVHEAVCREIDDIERSERQRIEAIKADIAGYARGLRAAEQSQFGHVLSANQWDNILYDEDGQSR